MTGTNGILVPPDGYMQGVRALCDKYGILMIADEVMSGFGRTGEWFAINHWNVVPDLITMAKGLTSSYVPLGAVGMRRAIADRFKDTMFPSGLTYNSHPLACATALAVDRRDGGRRPGRAAQRRGERDGDAARRTSRRGIRRLGPCGRSACSGSSSWCGTADARAAGAVQRHVPRDGGAREVLPQEGLFTFVRWNYFFTNPPLTISESELREAFAIIDRGLEITDQAVTS